MLLPGLRMQSCLPRIRSRVGVAGNDPRSKGNTVVAESEQLALQADASLACPKTEGGLQGGAWTF